MTYIEKFWRDATDKDVVDVMNGKEIEARFRDLDREDWSKPATLKGWTADGKKWLGFCAWNFCQVYDPPQWYLDKPEPGEGHRLLGKFPDEALQGGDFIRGSGGWTELANECNPVQQEGIWYRRRIEPPKPEPKFAVGQRVKIIGPKERPAVHWDGIMDKYINETAEVISVSSTVGEKVFYDLRFIEQWAFREDYLEADATPKHYALQVGDTADAPSGHRITITDYGVGVSLASPRSA